MQPPPRLPATTSRTATQAASPPGNLLAGLPLAPSAAPGMTEPEKRSKMWPVTPGLRVMNVLLVAQAGLFADAFAGSLAKLASRVEVQRYDPEALLTHSGNTPVLIVLDVDALGDQTAEFVKAAQERFLSATIVALGTALDDNFIAVVMGSGVKAYLPKSYSETQALGLLQVALSGGANSNGSAARESAVPVPETGVAPRKDRNQTNPYGLTARELEVLSKTH